MDGNIITQMGFFISDLHRQIEQLHKKQYADQSSTESFIVYRGQGVSKTEFDQLKKTKGRLMSFNNFLLTTKTCEVSFQFAKEVTMNPDLVEVLLVMTIDLAETTIPFASIRNITYSQNEDNVLFFMHSVFRIHDIKSIDKINRIYEVNLTITTDRHREESLRDADRWANLALVLDKIGQYNNPLQIYAMLLRQTNDEKKKAQIYNQLGRIKSEQREYQEAILSHEKELVINENLLPPNYYHLAAVYQDISLPRSHPSIASSYNNIGKIYNQMKYFVKALSYFEKALIIW
ncbi:hypothetical protein I4U23_025252 [Adineta vaga]|nr:hypothetical protein I4U23_025252 [Adineta vaga]